MLNCLIHSCLLLAEAPPGSPGYDSKSDLYHSGNVRNTGDVKIRLNIAAGDKFFTLM